MQNKIKNEGNKIKINYEGLEAVFSLDTLEFITGEEAIEDIYLGNDDIKIPRKLSWLEDMAYLIDPDEGHLINVFDPKYRALLLVYLKKVVLDEEELEDIVIAIEDTELSEGDTRKVFEDCFGKNNYSKLTKKQVCNVLENYMSRLLPRNELTQLKEELETLDTWINNVQYVLKYTNECIEALTEGRRIDVDMSIDMLEAQRVEAEEIIDEHLAELDCVKKRIRELE